jgi:hypothetical protein
MKPDDTYVLTDKGWEVYWREQIALEIQLNFMPICVCERCGNLHEGAMVQRIIETIKGRIS